MKDLGIRARGLCKSYDGRAVVTDFSVDVAPGTIAAILGPNGSGKSTALRLMALLEKPDRGVIEIDEDKFEFPEARKAASRPPWPKLTMVFQQLFLWPHLTVRQNIALPRRNFIVARHDPELEKLLDLFELREFQHRFPNQISGGQRQRTALARALAVQPRYLLLDEVTSALDIEQASTLLSHLKTLRERNIGIIMVTHLVGFARESADSVVFLWKGHVAEKGGKEVLDRPESPELRRFLSLL